MSTGTISTIGSEITVLRQRYFIDHTSNSQTFITVEYTMIANNDGIDNIFIEVPRFLLNLKIYDADDEQLPLLPNDYTYALLEDRIQKLSGLRKDALQKYYEEIREHKKYLLWIKLPPLKKLVKNQLRIITLEYDAEKKRKPSKKLELDFPTNETHNVFYAIRKPEDFEFTNADIEIAEGSNKPKKYKGENNKTDPIYVNTGFDSMVITKKYGITMPVKVRYSFQPDRNITAGPITLAALLSLVPLNIIISTICTGLCFKTPLPGTDVLIQHKIEIGLGIVAASLVLPTLVNNQRIRDSLRTTFYFPIILAIMMLFAR